ncbi:MAG: ABC transporter substrate-binding protein [Coriobacteriales bacterium]|nr:ABC transporter substrate-binding protein [Coriobacteriales bacterium]
MKRSSKLVASLFALALGAALVVGCTANMDANQTEEPQNTPEPVATSVTVTDAAGRQVTLDQPVDSILTVYGSKYILALGLGDKMVNGSTKDFELAVCPSLANGITFGSEQMNAETIAQINPDVFIHKATATELMGALDNLGVNSIGIYMETPEEVCATLELLGTALGVPDRAAELITYYQDLMNTGARLTANIPQDERPTAILMGNTIGKVAHGSMLQSIMIESAGGINLAKDVQGEGTWPVVGVEQIFEWDPDFIFIMNSTGRDYDAQTILNDPAWANLTAVQNGHVYVVPSDLDSWEYPCVQSGLGTIWMISKMYPDLITDAQLETYVNEFYDFVYGVQFTREELNY